MELKKKEDGFQKMVGRTARKTVASLLASKRFVLTSAVRKSCSSLGSHQIVLLLACMKKFWVKRSNGLILFIIHISVYNETEESLLLWTSLLFAEQNEVAVGIVRADLPVRCSGEEQTRWQGEGKLGTCIPTLITERRVLPTTTRFTNERFGFCGDLIW